MRRRVRSSVRSGLLSDTCSPVPSALIAVRRNVRLAEEAIERLIALCEEAGLVLDQQRAGFEGGCEIT